MSGDPGPEQATVHLRLRGPMGEDDLTALRQQLAACLCSGVSDIRVHVESQEDLDVRVLQALHGVADHLAARGGSLLVVGARPGVLKKIAVYELDRLLPPAPPALPPAAPALVPQEQLT